MNYLDFILVVPLIIGAWKGFKKGFIIEIFTLLALFAGLYGAIHFTDYIAEILKRDLSVESEYMPIIAFIITFLLVGAMVYFLGKMLEKAVSVVALSTANKFAGLLFGATKMLIVSGIIVVVLESIDEKNDIISRDLKERSILYEPLKEMAYTGLPALKESSLFKHHFFQDIFNTDKIESAIEDKVNEEIQNIVDEKIKLKHD